MSRPPDQPRKDRPAPKKPAQPKRPVQRKNGDALPPSRKKTAQPKRPPGQTSTKKTTAKKTPTSKSPLFSEAKAAKAKRPERKEERSTAGKSTKGKRPVSKPASPPKRFVRPRPVVLPERTRWFRERRRRSYFPIWVAVLLWVLLILVWVYISPRLPPIAPPGQPIPVEQERPTPTPYPGLLFPDFRG